MRSLPRLLAAAAALVALSLTAGACDTSPVAATINGRQIKQSQLDAELADLSANASYIKFVENQSGATVRGAGTDTYASDWTAYVLGQIVTADVVRQYLARTDRLPTGSMLTAARAVNSAFYPDWAYFSSGYRDLLTERTADLATLEGDFAQPTQLATYYKDFSTRLFSHVCVRTVAVTVYGSGGGVDYPASLTAARKVTSELGSGLAPQSSRSQGTETCYDPEELADQAPAFVTSVDALAAGAASAPQKTAYGYDVLAVTSRVPLPFDSDLRAAMSVGIYLGEITTRTAAVLARAQVSIDPQYGHWTGSATAGYRIEPVTAPAS